MKLDGLKFWSGTKRFPTAIRAYDPADPFHVMFVTAAANIFAAAFGLVPSPDGAKDLLAESHEWRKPELVNHIVLSLPVPPVTHVHIDLDDAAGLQLSLSFPARLDCTD